MFRRDIYADLLSKIDDYTKPILLLGARQVGKTTVL